MLKIVAGKFINNLNCWSNKLKKLPATFLHMSLFFGGKNFKTNISFSLEL
tara:strand:- start:3104 stop:3253 length:150 start_codon:yes stop_codon:yes gene_type:complete